MSMGYMVIAKHDNFIAKSQVFDNKDSAKKEANEIKRAFSYYPANKIIIKKVV